MKPGAEEFLKQKHIAVVGVSRGRGFGNMAFKHLKTCGYRVFPVNAAADTVEGEPCYKSLADITEPVDAVLTVVPPAQTEKIVAQCAERGIRHVWMQQGSESPAAVALCKEKGLNAVYRACIMMYAQPTGIHRFHGGIMKLLRKY